MQSSQIHFFFQDVAVNLRNRKRLKAQLGKLFRSEGKVLEQLNIIFCSDDRLLQMNRDFLQHDYYTDIITFPLSGKGKLVQAELYISIDRIRDNAKQTGITMKEEVHRVIFHGCLHLCGYKDKSSQQIKKMREREDHYLRLYFGKQP
jgi:rRNA maturation RNase YbeY